MNISLLVLRTVLFFLSMLFMTAFGLSHKTTPSIFDFTQGIALGLGLATLLLLLEKILKKVPLRSFNTTALGLFFGYLMGKALCLILQGVITASSLSSILQPHTIDILNICFYLMGVFLGAALTLRANEDLHISLPFIRFAHLPSKKKDFIVDDSLLSDPRIVDFASTGLLNNHLIIPKFLMKDLYSQMEGGDENSKLKARKSLETIKKLENCSEIGLRFHETDFPEIKDSNGKIIRLARLLDANILTSDISKVQLPSIEGITTVNMHALSSALKPLMQAGEPIKIKVQRIGKEPRQGVGYLEDGTMVVINGGGDFIGETIEAKVLSVKHTSSGRMIFCNASEEEGNMLYDEESFNRSSL